MPKHVRMVHVSVCLLAAFIIGGVGLWLRAERRQYALNRQLFAALVNGDNKQALALVNAGANPNTRYEPTSVPSLLQLVKQMLHRSPSPAYDSPTAFMIACGVPWNDDMETHYVQDRRTDNARLVLAMLAHGAKVNVNDKEGAPPLTWSVIFNRRKTVEVLIEHSATVNTQDKHAWTPLMSAVIWPGTTPDTIRLLLAHGANPNLADDDGVTPLRFAQWEKRSDIVILLKHYGATK